MRSYLQAGLTFKRGDQQPAAIKDLQRDLRQLGYLRQGIDGDFGGATELAVRALQHDLLNNDGRGRGDGNAPVRMVEYNQGRVTAVTGVFDQALGSCISAMLDDPRFSKLPSDPNPVQANARALAAVRAMVALPVPLPFLLAILAQESGLRHFCVPTAASEDNFIVLGLDTNATEKHIVTSRGYGIGQYTLFHHPPRLEEVHDIMLDPVQNVQWAIRELREKFNRFVNGPDDHADDRMAEHGSGPLRACKFAPDDTANFLRACRRCLEGAGQHDIIAGQTSFYEGSLRVYEPTQYHQETVYRGVPIRKDIPCDWPYAVRRYNGSGVNSYHYQTQVLLRVLRGEV
jgi:hypothetical protein